MDQASSFSGEHQPPPMLATHPSHWPRSVTPCANTVVQQATHALPRFAGSRQPCQLSSATSREGMRVFVQCATAASSRIRPSPTWHRSRYCVRFVLVRDMSHVFLSGSYRPNVRTDALSGLGLHARIPSHVRVHNSSRVSARIWTQNPPRPFLRRAPSSTALRSRPNISSLLQHPF
jgi:hypothetical protein